MSTRTYRSMPRSADRRPDHAWRWALVVLAVVAAVVRLWHVERVGVSHYDAGPYTGGILGVGPYGKAALVPFHAPDLVPWLHAGVFAVVGLSETALVVVHALIGAALVVAAASWGARLVGRGPAWIGAAALATMEYHVVYSRQPITDGVFAAAFLAALALLLHAHRTRSTLAWATAGLAVGATFLVKYHGFFPLVVVGVWFAALQCGRLVRARPSDRPGRSAWRGLVIAALVSAVPAAYMLWRIHVDIGFEEFSAHRARWMPQFGLHMFSMTATFLARGLAEWTSPVVLVVAALGLVRFAARRRAGDVLLLAWLGVFLAAMPFYVNYPRLLVPLLVPLCLAAGTGAWWLLELAGRRGAASAAVVGAVFAAVGLFETREVLGISDRGYHEAAEWLVASGPSVRPDLLVTQHAIVFPMRDAPAPFLLATEDEALDHAQRGDFRYVVCDLRELAECDVVDAARSHGLVEYVRFEHRMPEPFVVNVAGFEALDRARCDEDLAEILSTVRVFGRPPEE